MSKVIVRGCLTDFSGLPLSGGEVRFNDEDFNVLFSAHTDEAGYFEIEIERRKYASVFICKDYKTKFLEYWHWDFHPEFKEYLEVKIDGLELYGLKAWQMNPTYPGLMIFFRPMSLKRYKALGEPDKSMPVLIAPTLNFDDIKVAIDGRSAEVIGLNRVKEFISAEKYMDAYLAHIALNSSDKRIKRVTVTLVDRETNEHGMASVDLR